MKMLRTTQRWQQQQQFNNTLEKYLSTCNTDNKPLGGLLIEILSLCKN